MSRAQRDQTYGALVLVLAVGVVGLLFLPDAWENWAIAVMLVLAGLGVVVLSEAPKLEPGDVDRVLAALDDHDAEPEGVPRRLVTVPDETERDRIRATLLAYLRD